MFQKVPKYRCHKQPAGKPARAFVEIEGRRIYLGRYGTTESVELYRRALAEHATGAPRRRRHASDYIITELCSAYWDHATVYYRKDGRPTGELSWIRSALRPLVSLYGSMPVADFGRAELRAVRETMITDGVCRTSSS